MVLGGVLLGAVADCAGAVGVGAAAALSAGAVGVGAGSLIALREALAAGSVFVVEAFRELLEVDGAIVATFGAVVDLPGMTRDSSRVATELPLMLASAEGVAGCAGFAVAIGLGAVWFGEDVTRSSTNAPPTATAMIVPKAMPKWFTGCSWLAVMRIGQPRAHTRHHFQFSECSWLGRNFPFFRTSLPSK